MLPVCGNDSTRPAMALTNKQKQAILRKVQADVAAGKPAPAWSRHSPSTPQPEPPQPQPKGKLMGTYHGMPVYATHTMDGKPIE